MKRKARKAPRVLNENLSLVSEAPNLYTISKNIGRGKDLSSIGNHIHTAVLVGFFIALAVVVYYLYTLGKQYLLSKNVQVVIGLSNPTNPTVGETIACRVRFMSKDGKIISSSSETFHDLKANLVIEPYNETLKRKIAVLLETSNRCSHISGKFSVRKCGMYEIKVKYHSFYLTPETPLEFEVLPGPVSSKHMDFETHNPGILYITAGSQQYFKIRAEDEYGNRCRIEDVDLTKMNFQLFHMGNAVPLKHEFCYYTPIEDSSESESTERASDGSPLKKFISLKLTISQPGVYTCFLKYGQFQVNNNEGAPKLMVCLSSEEEDELKQTVSKFNLPGTLIYTCPCKLSFMGDEDGFEDYYVGVTATSLVFALYRIPLSLYPDIRFPISMRAKILHTTSQVFSGDSEHLQLWIQDGLRRSIKLQIELSYGRKFIIVFAHIQGFILPKSKPSFQEKKEDLKVQFSSYLDWFRFNSEKLVRVQHGNVIESSLKEVPTHPDDWLLPFRVIYEGGTCPSGPGMQAWINLLCEEFFNGNGGTCMFERLPGSKLLHPVSSTISHHPLQNYQLAGQILAKAVVETLLRGICTHLSQTRFTRSMLAFILGYPITFKLLEADEPGYFRQIMPIVESNLSGGEYTFTTYPSSKSDTNIVNLIPNGSNIPVTNANKEHYLNLLAHYRLIHKVEQEITAFRNGFFDVIDRDKLSNFQEKDLQQLISGGGTFSISDLKAHHRVVKEVDNGLITAIRRQSIDTKKILRWFWTAVENLSEEEQSYLIFFATGSFSLPSCGLATLNPLFTISLTGTFNQPPMAHPISNEIVLADHACFENFERSLLFAIKPESEKILLPTANQICLQLKGQCDEDNDDDYGDEGMETILEPQELRRVGANDDSLLTWLGNLISH